MSNVFDSSVDVLFGKVEELVSTKTVVGEAIAIGDLTILPLIEVSVGVGVGSGASAKQSNNEATAGGMGAKITPSAVLVIHNGNVQMLNVKNQDAVSKLIDMAPGVLSKLNFSAFFGKDEKEVNESEKEAQETTVFDTEIVTKE